ncbi:MAG: glycosyltransferase family 9 protein [Verrucomicrobium sp.]|nr:glycosyltransferase family 9 protein [Verrucomicrobium sp.]
MSGGPQNLLVVRPDRVGDVLISSSCLPVLRARFPEASLTYAARPAMAPLFQDHPDARFLPLPDPGLPFLRRVAVLRGAFRAGGFDCTVFLHPDPAAYLAAWQAGIPRRIGYPETWTGWTLTDRLPNHRPEHARHEALYNFDLLSPLEVPAPKAPRAAIALPEAAKASLNRKTLGRFPRGEYLCLHLGAHSPVARWPATHFLSIAEKLHQQYGLHIVLTGHDRKDPSHLAFQDNAGRLPYVDLAGELNLAETAWLIKGAKALVTRDTGPSHLAAAVGTPVVVLFGRTAPPYGPVRWAPLADADRVRVLTSLAGERRSGEDRDAYWRRSFASITPDAVLHALEDLLYAHHVSPV